MTSKNYFTIAGIFMTLYVVTTLGVMVGLPDWAHQICTIIFTGAVLLGLKRKKKENSNNDSTPSV